jgi:hypothetical protein
LARTKNQPTILIMADDAAFAPSVISHWQKRRTLPDFVCMGAELASGDASSVYDVAIVGPLQLAHLEALVTRLERAGRPLIYVPRESAPAARMRAKHPGVVCLPQAGEWQEAVVALAMEMLRRVRAVEAAGQAEQTASDKDHHASLGRYMLESRHGINNALTSLLGNAELALLNGAITPELRDHIETIHAMALRINETLKRFSSLEQELRFLQRHAQAHHA